MGENDCPNIGFCGSCELQKWLDKCAEVEVNPMLIILMLTGMAENVASTVLEVGMEREDALVDQSSGDIMH